MYATGGNAVAGVLVCVMIMLNNVENFSEMDILRTNNWNFGIWKLKDSTGPG